MNWWRQHRCVDSYLPRRINQSESEKLLSCGKMKCCILTLWLFRPAPVNPCVYLFTFHFFLLQISKGGRLPSAQHVPRLCVQGLRQVRVPQAGCHVGSREQLPIPGWRLQHGLGVHDAHSPVTDVWSTYMVRSAPLNFRSSRAITWSRTYPVTQ